MNNPNKLPAGVVDVDYLKPSELEHLLRQFNNLEGINVTASNVIQPWVFKLQGAINIYGQLHVYETEVNATNIRSADDVLALVAKLNESFEKASSQAVRH